MIAVSTRYVTKTADASENRDANSGDFHSRDSLSSWQQRNKGERCVCLSVNALCHAHDCRWPSVLTRGASFGPGLLSLSVPTVICHSHSFDKCQSVRRKSNTCFDLEQRNVKCGLRTLRLRDPKVSKLSQTVQVGRQE